MLKNTDQKKLQACNFIKKETLTQVLSSECREISKNTFPREHLQTTASKGTALTTIPTVDMHWMVSGWVDRKKVVLCC